MLGQGIGYLGKPPRLPAMLIATDLALAGGMIGDKIDIRAPFDVAFFSFIIAGIFVRLTLPYIPPEQMTDGKKPGQQGASGFLAPLRVLVPQRLRLANGTTRKHLGVIFLCMGIFLGVVSLFPQPFRESTDRKREAGHRLRSLPHPNVRHGRL